MDEFRINVANPTMAAEAMTEPSLVQAVEYLQAEVRRQREEIRKLQAVVEELMERSDPKNINRILGGMLKNK